MPRINPLRIATARRTRTLFIVIVGACALAQPVAQGQSASKFEAPWVGTSLADVVPATADILGAGFQPYQSLWLDLTDPLGGVYTVAIASDGEGRIAVAVPADQPGTHQVRIRDAAGQVLSEDEIFFAAE